MQPNQGNYALFIRRLRQTSASQHRMELKLVKYKVNIVLHTNWLVAAPRCTDQNIWGLQSDLSTHTALQDDRRPNQRCMWSNPKSVQ